MPMPKPISWPSRRHFSVSAPIAPTHFERHLHGLECRVLNRHWIVEDHHDAVTRIALQGAAVFDDDLANSCVIVAQQRHHVFRVRDFGEPL
jgi:hypothetical protein